MVLFLMYQWSDQLDQIRWSTGCKVQVNYHRKHNSIILNAIRKV